MTSIAWGDFRSSTIARLLRLRLRYSAPICWLRDGDDARKTSPVGPSTLMTSAPYSASVRVPSGPAITAVRSMTRTPVNAPFMGQLLLYDPIVPQPGGRVPFWRTRGSSPTGTNAREHHDNSRAI